MSKKFSLLCTVFLGVLSMSVSSALAIDPRKDWIAFARVDSAAYPDADIYVVRPDGSELTPLVAGSSDDFDPAWSPDGKKLVFMSTRDRPQGELYILDIQTLTVERLTNSVTSKRRPVWSPDGSKIAYSSYDAIRTVQVDTKVDTVVATTPSSDYSYDDVVWYPKIGSVSPTQPKLYFTVKYEDPLSAFDDIGTIDHAGTLKFLKFGELDLTDFWNPEIPSDLDSPSGSPATPSSWYDNFLMLNRDQLSGEVQFAAASLDGTTKPVLLPSALDLTYTHSFCVSAKGDYIYYNGFFGINKVTYGGSIGATSTALTLAGGATTLRDRGPACKPTWRPSVRPPRTPFP